MTGYELRQLFVEKGLNIPADFHFGEKITVPNQMGCYDEGDGWYLYDVDEHGLYTICGPFDDNSITYACALKLHVSSSMPEWKFSEHARYTYMHVHIHKKNPFI